MADASMIKYPKNTSETVSSSPKAKTQPESDINKFYNHLQRFN